MHIHPMDYPRLSGPDIANFERLRMNPDDPSPLGGESPYPIILVNLSGSRSLEILGFWVYRSRAYAVPVRVVADDAAAVMEAWARARPMPFFSQEAETVRRIDRQVGSEWQVELGIHPRSGAKAIKARKSNGQKVLLKFDKDVPLGLSQGGAAPRRFPLEDYVDWARLLEDLVSPLPSTARTLAPAADSTATPLAIDAGLPGPASSEPEEHATPTHDREAKASPSSKIDSQPTTDGEDQP